MSNPTPNHISHEDIPPARRQSMAVALDAKDAKDAKKQASAWRRQPQKRSRSLAIGLLAIASLLGLGLWQWNAQSSGISANIAARETNQSANQPANQAANQPANQPANQAPQTLLNHRRYEEAPLSDLVPLNPNSAVKLQPAAQASINALIAKAKSEGVEIGVLSGFRNLEDQNYLYFELKAERGESAQTRAEVSAPPGYSEHHTGYAVDLIDETMPATDLELSFEKTPAFQWLSKNAAFFNFEMSFPKDPDSLVGYEPWHWRYVGDQKSLELFYHDVAPDSK